MGVTYGAVAIIGLVVVGVIAAIAVSASRSSRDQQLRHEAERFQVEEVTMGGGGGGPLEPVQSSPKPGSAVAWIPAGHAIEVAKRSIPSAMTYVGARKENADAGTVVTSLKVGRGTRATQMGYWPSYIDATPDQRALYLDWMAGGRSDPEVPIGYVFIFFYGLERRAFIDGADLPEIRGEVLRLLGIYGPYSGSFHGYASRFLAFTALSSIQEMSAANLEHALGDAGESELALAAVLAWHHDRGAPLPAKYAMFVASSMDDAKRGVVVTRAYDELVELFSTRYGEVHGDGIRLVAGKRPRVESYHPASGTLLRVGLDLRVQCSNVLARRAQFKSLVKIWNGCVEDLRQLSRTIGKEGRDEGEPMTAQMWEALPDELRQQVDHPDQDRWHSLVAGSPRAGSVHLVSVGDLAELAGLPVADKVTASKARKLVQTASLLELAMEPDPRTTGKSLPWAGTVAMWRTSYVDAPDPRSYGPVSALMALMMAVVIADGIVDEGEIEVVSRVIDDMFTLDEAMRRRVEAMREVLIRNPARATTIAKKLRETKTPEQVSAIGRILVAIAGADSVLDANEHKTLKKLYRSLGLTTKELDAALIAAGLRPAVGEPVKVRKGAVAEGEPIPPPKEEGVALDQSAIARIMADTHEVAAILSDILDDKAEEDEDHGVLMVKVVDEGVVNSPVGALVVDLDVRYQPIVVKLLERPSWSADEIRALAARHHVMPNAVYEIVNTWAEDALGDELLEDQGNWVVHAELLKEARS